MADLNVSYSGYIEHFDPDVEIDYSCGILRLPFGGCIGAKEPIYLPDEIREYIRNLNQSTTSTNDAVKVAYVAGTNRLAWLQDRQTAVSNRAKFIQARVTDLTTGIQNAGGTVDESTRKTFITVSSAIPVVGVVFAIAGKLVNGTMSESNQETIANNNLLIGKYSTDFKQLVDIKTQLDAEQKSLTNSDPTSNAPNIRTDYLIYIVIALFLLFFVWYRRRKTKRRKR